MKKSILTILLMATAGGLFAAPTTADDAAAVVTGWVRENRDGFGALGAVAGVTSERAADGTLLWHLVRTANGAVVVAPDDEIGPVIAAIPGSAGALDPKSPLRALLVRDMRVRLNNIAVTRTGASGGRSLMAAAPAPRPAALADECARATSAWRRLTAKTGPTLAAAMTVKRPATIYRWLDGWNGNTEVSSLRFWNQTDSAYISGRAQVFNYYTPNHDPCGCVATAGAAVMQYFGSTTGPKSGTVGSVTVDGEARNQTCKGGPYDWSILPKFADGGSKKSLTDAQLKLLAKVPYDIGTMIEMDYSAEGSGSFSGLLQQALVTHFGFKSAVYVSARGESYANTGDDTVKLIYNQIRGGAPVLMGISGEAGGHEVVATGYGEDADGTQRCYVFMGWGGVDDAWYALPAILGTLDASGNASDEGFNVLDEIITMLSTDGKSVPVVGEVVTSDGERYTADLQDGEELEVELPDGQLVRVDENGFWGGRVAPGAGTFEVFLANGSDAVEFQIGSLQTTGWGSAAAMAEATPAAITIVYDGGLLLAYSKFDKAWVRALKEGKQLLVFSGAKAGDDWATVKEALKELADPENGGTEGFNERYVVYISDTAGADGSSLSLGGAVSYALVDPRLVTQPTFANVPETAFYLTNSFPAGVTATEVKERLPGELEAALAAWTAADRSVTAGEITGPHVADNGNYTNHQKPKYALTLTFADGVTLALDNRYPEVWSATDWADDRVGGEFKAGGTQGQMSIIGNPGGSDETAEGVIAVQLDIWNGSYSYGDYAVKVYYRKIEIVTYAETANGQVLTNRYETWPSQPVSVMPAMAITNYLDKAKQKGVWIRRCTGYEGTGGIGSGTFAPTDRGLTIQWPEEQRIEIMFLYEDYAWWVEATTATDFSHADIDVNTGWYTNNQEVTVHGTIAHTNTWIIWAGLGDFATETAETSCTFVVTAPINFKAIAVSEVASGEVQALEPDATREDGVWYYDKSLNEALPGGYVVVSQVVTDENQNQVIHYAVTQGEYPPDPEPDPPEPPPELVQPVITAIAVQADGSVLITVGEVRKDLTYTILAADEPGGAFTPVEGQEILATEDGELVFALPKDGPKQFYKARAAVVTEP